MFVGFFQICNFRSGIKIIEQMLNFVIFSCILVHFRMRRRESRDWAGQWCTGGHGGSTGSWPFPEPSVSQSLKYMTWLLVEHETCISRKAIVEGDNMLIVF